MYQRLSRNSFLALCLAGAALALPSCAKPVERSATGQYRTITVDPQRNTDEAKRLNQVGLDCLAKDQLDPAADAFTAALSADAEFGPAHNNLGKVYYQRKDWYKAAWEFEYALKFLPRHAEPRNNLGLVLEQTGQLDQAVEHYRQAVALSSDLQYRANLARVLVRRGERTDETRDLLQQVADQDPRPPWRDWARKALASLGKPAP